MQKVTDGVVDVIVYPSASDKSKNRGFAFVEYESHRAAAMARRKLINGRVDLWGHNIAVDWAEPELEVDAEIMAQVRGFGWVCPFCVVMLIVVDCCMTSLAAFKECCSLSSQVLPPS